MSRESEGGSAESAGAGRRESPADLVRRWFARLAAGDLAPEMCDPEIEIRNWDASPVPGPFRGHRGLNVWWRGVHDADISTEARMFDLEEIHELDAERVLTIQRARLSARSGIELEQLWGSIITVRGGRIAAAHGYPTAAEARAAAGLDAG